MEIKISKSQQIRKYEMPEGLHPTVLDMVERGELDAVERGEVEYYFIPLYIATGPRDKRLVTSSVSNRHNRRKDAKLARQRIKPGVDRNRRIREANRT